MAGANCRVRQNRLETSVSFRFLCFTSSDFVAGRSAILVTDATDFGLDWTRNRRLVDAGDALVAGGHQAVTWRIVARMCCGVKGPDDLTRTQFGRPRVWGQSLEIALVGHHVQGALRRRSFPVGHRLVRCRLHARCEVDTGIAILRAVSDVTRVDAESREGLRRLIRRSPRKGIATRF